MIILFHGENNLASRRALREKLNFLKKEKEVIKIDGQKASLTDIKQACETNSLFSQLRLLIIENFYSRAKSKEKTEIEKYLRNLAPTKEIIFWEQKQLTPSQLKKLPPKTKVYFFKVEPLIFKFLDALRPNNQKQIFPLLRQCYQKESAEMIFYMLCRQIRLLILAKDLNRKGLSFMPYWMQNKFLYQSRFFTLEQLLEIHRRLLQIDYQQKTGLSSMPLSFHLDLLAANL